jgi:hypothetical protein
VLATSIIPSPYIYLSIAQSSFFTFWLDKAYSSTQVDGKFAAESGGCTRRFRTFPSMPRITLAIAYTRIPVSAIHALL